MLLLVLVGGDESKYHGDCPASFSCGYLGNISFPFTTTERPDCGLLPIPNCGDDPLTPKMIQFKNKGKQFEFQVEIVSPLEFRSGNATCNCVFRDKKLYNLLQNRSCDAFRYNYTLPPPSDFVSFNMETHATLFMCNRTLHVNPPSYMHNYTKCPLKDLYYQPYHYADNASRSAFTACTNVRLPIKDISDNNDPFTFVTADISIQVSITKECAYCHYNQSGRCKLDSTGRFYCADAVIVSEKKGLSRNINLGIGNVLHNFQHKTFNSKILNSKNH
ncbi:non-specific serine/threonine protein kinase [Trifolium repens]|nr:non-specific serine/threonine protein kinase [Trifolium repens]